MAMKKINKHKKEKADLCRCQFTISLAGLGIGRPLIHTIKVTTYEMFVIENRDRHLL